MSRPTANPCPVRRWRQPIYRSAAWRSRRRERPTPAAANDAAVVPAVGGRDQGAVGGLPEAPRPPATVQVVQRAPASHMATPAGLRPWPVREADNDRIPLDIVLAYAAEPQRDR